jgi:molybdopterin-containing oxidoreductase family iron-sulfur binding subunit
MSTNRRDFLKLAGLSVAGLATATTTGCSTSRAQGHQAEKGHREPRSGTRWAMVVDMTEPCPEGCDACSKECHRVHNVPDWDGHERHEIKWIWNEHYEHVFANQVDDVPVDHALLEQPVPVLCNHCDNPPCVQVCPTKATFQTPEGIVAMDMHRCIGCRYCMAACPYGARSFNFKDPRIALEAKGAELTDFPTRSLGVAEKCNFCAERITADPKATPACVEACQRVCAEKGREPVLVFGDLNEEGSAVLAKVRAAGTRLRRRTPHLGTVPHVFYVV